MDLQRRVPQNRILQFSYGLTETAFFSLFYSLVHPVSAKMSVIQVVYLWEYYNFY
jgi:hypothetical protein